ncbi:MAG: hypothetical protein R3F16_21300 [Myxococcota bacterium]
MQDRRYEDVPAETRTFSEGRKWLSPNDDKAWAEKLYLVFIPIFFGYNAVIQNMGWLDAGNFWHTTQNLLMWVPYCVVLPMILRRNHPLPYHQQWWFKFQVYLFVLVFWLTFFHTEYFFEALGMRYRFPDVSWYFDSAYLGPDQATALETFQRIPIGMYLNTMAFFTVYHIASPVVIRRLSNLAGGGSAAVRRAAFFVAVAITALFFAWAETFFYMTAPAHDNVWYIDLPWMLKIGSWFYMIYFVFTFPNVFGLDERREQQPWSHYRLVIEPTAMALFILFVLDLWVLVGLPTVPGPG